LFTNHKLAIELVGHVEDFILNWDVVVVGASLKLEFEEGNVTHNGRADIFIIATSNNSAVAEESWEPVLEDNSDFSVGCAWEKNIWGVDIEVGN